MKPTPPGTLRVRAVQRREHLQRVSFKNKDLASHHCRRRSRRTRRHATTVLSMICRPRATQNSCRPIRSEVSGGLAGHPEIRGSLAVPRSSAARGSIRRGNAVSSRASAEPSPDRRCLQRHEAVGSGVFFMEPPVRIELTTARLEGDGSPVRLGSHLFVHAR
jgi:hypothetical protein